jgi:hypothetical protein
MHFFLFSGVDAFPSDRVRCSGCSWNCFERHEFPWTLLHFYQQHCWNLRPASLIVLSKFATCDVSMPYVESTLSSDVALSNLWECSCICLCYEGTSLYYKVPLFVALAFYLTCTSEFVRLHVFIHSYDCSCYWTFTESVGAAILKLWYWSTRGVWCFSCSSHGSSSSVLFMIEGDGSDAPWAAALTSLQPQSFGGLLPLNALLSQKVFSVISHGHDPSGIAMPMTTQVLDQLTLCH